MHTCLYHLPNPLISQYQRTSDSSTQRRLVVYALPLSSCGLRLDDSAVQNAVGIRVAASRCEPLQCPSGAMVDPKLTHGRDKVTIAQWS